MNTNNKNVPPGTAARKIGDIAFPFSMPTGEGSASMSSGGKAQIQKTPTTSASPIKDSSMYRNADLPSPGMKKGAETIQKQASQRPNWNYP